jgi:hypothetical protein
MAQARQINIYENEPQARAPVAAAIPTYINMPEEHAGDAPGRPTRASLYCDPSVAQHLRSLGDEKQAQSVNPFTGVATRSASISRSSYEDAEISAHIRSLDRRGYEDPSITEHLRKLSTAPPPPTAALPVVYDEVIPEKTFSGRPSMRKGSAVDHLLASKVCACVCVCVCVCACVCASFDAP